MPTPAAATALRPRLFGRGACANAPCDAPPGTGTTTAGKGCSSPSARSPTASRSLGLPALGGLFAQTSIPDLEAAQSREPRAAWRRSTASPGCKDGAGLVPRQLARHGDRGAGLGLREPARTDPDADRRRPRLCLRRGRRGQGQRSARPRAATTRPTASCRRCSISALDPVLDRVEAEADESGRRRCSASRSSIPPAAPATSCWRAARRIATRVGRARSWRRRLGRGLPPRAARCGRDPASMASTATRWRSS